MWILDSLAPLKPKEGLNGPPTRPVFRANNFQAFPNQIRLESVQLGAIRD
jgi:hypothetical protein